MIFYTTLACRSLGQIGLLRSGKVMREAEYSHPRVPGTAHGVPQAQVQDLPESVWPRNRFSSSGAESVPGFLPVTQLPPCRHLPSVQVTKAPMADCLCAGAGLPLGPLGCEEKDNLCPPGV